MRTAIKNLSAAICLASIAALCGTCFGQTAEQLIGGDVSDFGPQYKQVEQGVVAFKRGDVNTARQLFAAAKKSHPQLPPGDVLLARLLTAANKLAEARSVLDSAMQTDSTDPEAYLLLADLEFSAGHVAIADLVFQRGAQLTTDYDRNKLRLKQMQIRSAAGQAAVAEAEKNWDEAKKHLTAWSKITPENAAIFARLASAQFQAKEYAEAKKSLIQQAKLSESKIPAAMLMARMYDQAGMEEEAKKEIELALAAEGTNADTLLAAAEIELRRGRLEEAKAHIDAVLKTDSTDFRAMTLAGRAARYRNDDEKAKEYFNYVTYRSPGRFDASNQLARVLAVSEDEKEKRKGLELAELNFRAYSDRNTQTGREAAVTMGWILFELGKEANAEAAISAALRGGAISSESAYLAAQVLSKRGKTDVARAILAPIAKANMQFPHFVDALKLLEELNKG